MILGLAWRQLLRELRSGEIRLLFAALVIAVSAVTAVGFFTDRVRQALDVQARQMIGGDLVIASDHPLTDEWLGEARRLGLEIAESESFPSMAVAGSRLQLADIKAVSETYPLRGQLGISGKPVVGGPRPGSAWIDERLAAVLQLGVGGRLTVGNATLEVAGILTQEPDRGINFLTLAPRLLMNRDDLASSGLIQPGARVTYRLMLAGEATAVAQFRRWAEGRLQRGEKIEDIRNARPEIRGALDRAERFLGLSAALTVVLSAAAVAMAARRYMQRQLDTCAVLRCLGLRQGQLLWVHALVFGGLGLFAAMLGGMLGFVSHFVLLQALKEIAHVELPLPGWGPLIWGYVVALGLLGGFAWPPLLQLSRVPTLRVLRRELGAPAPGLLVGYLIGFAVLAGLVFVAAGDERLGALTAGGFAVALGAFWLLARGAIALLGSLRAGRFLRRHAAANALQVGALAVGMTALLLLTATRSELLAAWERSIPADAPNRFVINIQPDQLRSVSALLGEAGIGSELQPMVRARLTRIGERAVSADSYPEDERAQRLVEREFNLSWRQTLPSGNRVVAGRWFSSEDAGQAVASVEEGLAKTLGIAVGDELDFMVAGSPVRLKVTSLRKLDWDSMRVNFFVIAPPGVFDRAPTSYITSFHAPEDGELTRRLLAAFPNLTVIDVGAMLAQLRSLVGQVADAVRFVFVFTLLAGAVVLHAALLSAIDERRRELAVMRVLGASTRQLRAAMLAELGVVGALAGLFSGGAALAIGSLIARQVFQLQLAPDWALPLFAAMAGAAFAMVVGWFSIRRLAATSPLLVLRTIG
jgi:putative ABC transport system permease protein